MSRYKVYVGLNERDIRDGVVVAEPPLTDEPFLKSLKVHKVKTVISVKDSTELHISKPVFDNHVMSTEAQVIKVQRLVVAHLVEQGHEVDSPQEVVLLAGSEKTGLSAMEEIEEYFTNEYGPIASQPADTMAY